MPATGRIVWTDLTVANADTVKDFYCHVVGWTPTPLSMGGYNDYLLAPEDGEGIAGVCHARGINAGVPPQWLIYVTVESVAAAAQRCLDSGGAVVDGPRPMAGKNFCIIRDPAGAYMALIEE